MKEVEGSSKNIYIGNKYIEFEFTDHFSVFDYGRMPDQIKGKAEASIQISSYFDELLKEHNLPTSRIKEINKTKTKHKKYPVYKPTKENNKFSYNSKNYYMKSHLIPLEVIFRHSLTKNSSLLKRKNKEELDLENNNFKEIYVEFSTKLEPKDRYLNREEAFEISGISEEHFTILECITRDIASLLKEELKSKNLELIDGKLEFAYDEELEQIVMIDSIGLDELRINYKSLEFSKQVIRNWYKKSYWLNDSKDKPEPLKQNQLNYLSDMYSYLAAWICKGIKPHSNFFEYSKWIQNSYKAMVVGDGGREYVLTKELAKSLNVSEVILASKVKKSIDDCKISNYIFEDQKDLLELAKHNKIDLIVIGPEKYLVDAYADLFRKNGIKVFGPDADQSKIESSKKLSKKIMREAGIKTPNYYDFTSLPEAKKFIENMSPDEKTVIKANGLASGKGVYVCQTRKEAVEAIINFENNQAISDKNNLILEDYIDGKELSAFAIFDKGTFQYLGTACDYKRVRNNDQGPNTGGMGTYSPCDYLSQKEEDYIKNKVFKRLYEYFNKNNIDFRGVIFAGLIKNKNGIQVLEFNVRFGDPETQSLLPRLKTDLFEHLYLCASSKLNIATKASWVEDFGVHVVVAAQGYPGTEGQPVKINQEFSIKEENFKIDDIQLCLAGASYIDGKYMTTGGRVLGLSAFKQTKQEAAKAIYKQISQVKLNGMHYRTDIAE